MASLPSIEELQAAARRLVHRAKRDNTLSALTPRIVREKLADQFGVDQSDLDTPELKRPIREATTEAAGEDTEQGSDDDRTNAASSSKKKSSSKAPASGTSKKRKLKKVDLSGTEDEGASEIESASRKRKSSMSKTSGKKKSKVLDSDDEPDFVTSAVTSSKERDTTPPETNVSADTGAGSDSEMSVLIDATPVKNKKGSRQKTEKKEKKPKTAKSSDKPGRAKKEKAELSKDEEEIKRLKAFIAACGVRKQWTKELSSFPTPSQQIRRLKVILSELGMTGRLSMEKAKQIKAQREFAQELEDVQEYNNKVNRHKNKPRSAQADAKASRTAEFDTSSGGSEKGESDEDVPKKRPRNAAQSINAFLGDQSDSD